MRQSVKISLWSASSILILTLFFTFALPAILRSVLKNQLEKNLHRPATVESVIFNPLTLSLSVQGLTIRESDSNEVFFSLEHLRANLEITSAIKGGIVLSEVTLVKPHARIVHTEANQYNFSDILTTQVKQPQKPAVKEPTEPFLFSIANIRLIDGSVEFDDQPQNVIHHITNIDIGLPLISNFKKNVALFVQPSFSATIEGQTFQMNGQTKPFADSQETDFDLQLDNLSLAQYLPYIPEQLNFTMPSGSLSTHLKLRYVQNNDSSTEIQLRGNINLADLTLVNLDNSPLASIPSLSVSGIDCALNKRELVIDDISLKSLSLALVREKGGTFLLKQLFADANEDVPEEPTEPETDADTEPDWSVLIKNFKSVGAAINFTDQLPPQPARITIDNFDVTLTNISTTEDTPAAIDLTCRINSEGTLGIDGTFALVPPAANLNVELNELDIRFVQNYLPNTLLIALNNGTLGLKGNLDFKQTGEGKPAVMWQGNAGLTALAAGRKGARGHFLKFSSLELKSIRAGNAPLSLDIKTVSLANLFLRTIVETDGTLNLSSLNTSPAEPRETPKTTSSKEPLPRINISNIVLKKGRVAFTDKSITPRYTTELADITGRIKGISSTPDSQATIRLNAKLNRYAPFAITGTISPLQKKLNADISVKFDNVDLSPFSPYSGKFIGRTVKKGALSLDLNYSIHNNQLTSQNKFFIDQMTLGGKVDSKDATRLPVGLAISLLKNREGEIELDLPISGSLDDPTFRVRKVLLKTLVNLLEKVATSPFALVGALIPGGADVSTIAFPCGTARFDDEATKKLDAIADLLMEKADLRLEIQPLGEIKIDTESLRREMVMLRMQQLKFKKMSKRERNETVPEQTAITANEYEKYLWQAYKAEKFEKPKGALGLTKRLPVNEMERLLSENMQVDDEDVNELIDRRGLAVKQYLNETAGVPAERLFIIDSRIESLGSPAGCAVTLNLK